MEQNYNYPWLGIEKKNFFFEIVSFKISHVHERRLEIYLDTLEYGNR